MTTRDELIDTIVNRMADYGPLVQPDRRRACAEALASDLLKEEKSPSPMAEYQAIIGEIEGLVRSIGYKTREQADRNILQVLLRLTWLVGEHQHHFVRTAALGNLTKDITDPPLG